MLDNMLCYHNSFLFICIMLTYRTFVLLLKSYQYNTVFVLHVFFILRPDVGHTRCTTNDDQCTSHWICWCTEHYVPCYSKHRIIVWSNKCCQSYVRVVILLLSPLCNFSRWSLVQSENRKVAFRSLSLRQTQLSVLGWFSCFMLVKILWLNCE